MESSTSSSSITVTSPLTSGDPEVQPPVREGLRAQGTLTTAFEIWGEVARSRRKLHWMEIFKKEGVGTAHVESFVNTLESLTYKRRGQGMVERQIISLTWDKKLSDEKKRLSDLKVRKEQLRLVIGVSMETGVRRREL